MSLFMLILLIVAAIVLFGLGFVVKWLFYIAAALFLIWIISLLLVLIRKR
ncbi:MAG: hydrophobic protein [Actinobacteria bacterium]|nr:hydrophobic protein [Actinomycetota bacterium]